MIDGQKLKQARERKNYSQEDLAKATGIGLATIRRYESGASGKTEIVITLARFLGVSTDYLLGLSGELADETFNLTTDEQALLEAYRQGDKVKAMELVVNNGH